MALILSLDGPELVRVGAAGFYRAKPRVPLVFRQQSQDIVAGPLRSGRGRALPVANALFAQCANPRIGIRGRSPVWPSEAQRQIGKAADLARTRRQCVVGLLSANELNGGTHRRHDPVRQRVQSGFAQCVPKILFGAECAHSIIFSIAGQKLN